MIKLHNSKDSINRPDIPLYNQLPLSYSLRKNTAECLSTCKNFKIGNITNNLETQYMLDKQTKILFMEENNIPIKIHCACKYAWKSTTKWQYGYFTESQIWLLEKFIKSNSDYVAILNKKLNQLILIPKQEFKNVKITVTPIFNKITKITTTETLYIIPYFENTNIEYYAKKYSSPDSSWIRKTLDGKNLWS